MTRASSIQMYAYLAFVVAVVVAADQEACDKTKCSGPLKIYTQLDCKPVYEKEGDCCPIKYNCDHVYERSTAKCYINGKEYNIGEKLKEEDANPCDINCICRNSYDGVASFNCAIVDCFGPPPKPNCYRRSSPSQCCAGEEICLKPGEERATCVVDGKTYKDGDYFTVKEDPDMRCVCQPGYEGKNIEPFCAKPKHSYCSPDFRRAGELHRKCAPVYYDRESMLDGCHVESRCQNDNDTVIHKHSDLKSGEHPSDENMCEYGNLKMHIGDELSPSTDIGSTCVNCVCEVPPMPSCIRLQNCTSSTFSH